MGQDAYRPTNEPQRLTVEVELLVGAHHEAVLERLRRSIVEELLAMGTEITAVSIEIRGQMAAW